MPDQRHHQRKPGLKSLMAGAAWRLRIKLVFAGLFLLAGGFGAGWLARWFNEPAASSASTPSPAASASVSASPPKKGSVSLMYVASGNPASIREFPLGYGGDVAPSRVIAGPLTGLKNPSAIAVDRRGDIFVVNDAAILSFAPMSDGNASPSAIIADPATSLVSLDRPKGIAVGGREFLFVLTRDGIAGFQSGANGNVAPVVQVSNPRGQPYVDFDFYWSRGIATDYRSNIYVTTEYTKSSVLYYPAGSRGQTLPASVLTGSQTGLQRPNALAVDGKGNLYVLNYGGPSITVYRTGARGDSRPEASIFGPATNLSLPQGIAVDADGNIYVVDSSRNAIFEFAAGANGNTAPKATISGDATGLGSPSAISIGP
jgi:NHL repeat